MIKSTNISLAFRSARQVAICACVVTSITACGNAMGSSNPVSPELGVSETADGAATASGDWNHTSDATCSFDAPSGWIAKANADGVKIADPTGQVFVFIAPYLSKSPVAPSVFARQAPTLYAAELPDAKTLDMKSSSGSGAHLGTLVRYTLGSGSVAEGLCVGDGHCGALYCIAAPSDKLATEKPVLLRVLNSFKFQGPLPQTNGDSGASAAVDLPMTTWTDPREGAFSLSVPQGWNVSGGLYRYAAVDVRPDVTVTSPDGSISVRIGDQRIPSHTLPNPLLEMAHLRPGMMYDAGYGV